MRIRTCGRSSEQDYSLKDAVSKSIVHTLENTEVRQGHHTINAEKNELYLCQYFKTAVSHILPIIPLLHCSNSGHTFYTS